MQAYYFGIVLRNVFCGAKIMRIWSFRGQILPINEISKRKLVMSKIKKISVVIVLCLVLTALIGNTVYAYKGVTAADTSSDNIQTINGTMTGFGTMTSWDYPYSDDFFNQPSGNYNHLLARCSTGLSVAAFRDTNNKLEQADNLVQFLSDAKFEDISTETYNTEPTKDSVAYGLAHKQIGDFTLVAVAICGGNYSMEWAGNFTVGDGVRAEGFDNAAKKAEAAIDEYISKQNITKDVKIWITGYSRGAAVANIAAADLNDSGKFKDVFAYCIASPRTTKEPGNYSNIFNIIGKDDIVTKLPFADWGFARYGVDMYTKSIEADSDIMENIAKTNEVYKQLISSNMTVNPEITSQLRVIFDYICMILPDTKTYTEKFQPILLDSMDGGLSIGITGLINIMSQFEKNNPQNSQEIGELTEYLQSLANSYILRGNKEQKKSGAWDVELGMTNLFNEHLPYKYIARLFAYDDPDRVFSENTTYMQLAVYGTVNLQIICGGKLVETVKSDGTIQNFYSDKYYNMPDVRVGKATKTYGQQIMLTLPGDSDWDIYASSDSIQGIVYVGSSMSAETIHTQISSYQTIDMEKNQLYKISVKNNSISLDEEMEKYTKVYEAYMDGEYSPTQHMLVSTLQRKYLTINEVFGIGILLAALIAFELLLSIILAIVRKVRKKERKGAATWIWTLVNAAIFTLLELQLWYYIPAYPIAKALMKLIVLLLIIMVLLKGWSKYKNKRNRILVPCLIAAAAADFVLEWFFIGEQNSWNMFIPAAVYLILMLSSWFVWHEPKKKDSLVSGGKERA